jgi:hypothetical protein
VAAVPSSVRLQKYGYIGAVLAAVGAIGLAVSGRFAWGGQISPARRLTDATEVEVDERRETGAANRGAACTTELRRGLRAKPDLCLTGRELKPI